MRAPRGGAVDARLVTPPVLARRLVVKPEAEQYQYKPCNGTTQEQASGALLDGAIPIHALLPTKLMALFPVRAASSEAGGTA